MPPLPLITIEPASRRLSWPWWSVVIVAVWLSAVGVYELAKRADPAPALPSTLCVFRQLTDVPCPTCGATRAVLAAGSGDMLSALRFNPLAVAVGALALIWIVLRVGFGRALVFRQSRRGRRITWVVAAGLLLVNWAFVVWQHS